MENENWPEAKPAISLLALDFLKLYKSLVQGFASRL